MRIGTLITGLLLVLLGEIFFLVNFGYGSWRTVYEIIQFWPVAIILIGLAIFWQGKLPRLLAYLIIILAVTAAGYYMVTEKPEPYVASVKTLSISEQQYPDTKQGKLNIDYGGGKLSITSGTQNLMEAALTRPITQHVAANDQGLDITLSQHNYHWDPKADNLNDWQLKISPTLIWDLDIDAGAIDGQIDLTGIPFRKLDCDLGAGNMLFILGNNGDNSKIKINSGASSITLRIARETGIRVKLDGALKSSNLDDLGWSKEGGFYVSPNYQQAASKIDCDIDLALGNLDIEVP